MRLTRMLSVASLILLAVLLSVSVGTGRLAAMKSASKPPCQPDLAHCPDEGCGKDFDPNLNRQKNIRESDPRAQGKATPHTLSWMKNLEDPENFEKGGDRDELERLGEGQKIAVVAYLLRVKPEGAESCNCGLTRKEWTDNHLVLVTAATVRKYPPDTEEEGEDAFHLREKESITAEFTPRVRESHPNFTRGKVQPLIDATEDQALLVRITGMLMFDSEHFLHNPLKRVNNWEIHPILKLEVCTAGKSCTAKSDAGWQSLDDL